MTRYQYRWITYCISTLLAFPFLLSAATEVDADCCYSGATITYSFPGVVLSAFAGADVNVYAFETEINSTPRNVFAHDTGDPYWYFDSVQGDNSFEARFRSPVQFVSLDFLENDGDAGNRSDVGRLEIYDSDDRLLMSLETGAVPSGGVETLSWTSPTPNISYIRAGGSEATCDNIHLDHLVYSETADYEPVEFVSTSSASYDAGRPLAPEAIAAGFGSGLAPGTVAAAEMPLPENLDGTSVEVTDSSGVSRPAPVFFVSTGQINYLVPAGTAMGRASVRVRRSREVVATGEVEIDAVTPGVYCADGTGVGPAAGFYLRVLPDGSRTTGLLFNPETALAEPIDVDASHGDVYLLLFGTGFRGYISEVTAKVDGQDVAVMGAGAQAQFAGLDQINIGPLPASLLGKGEVEVILTADGREANAVRVAFQ